MEEDARRHYARGAGYFVLPQRVPCAAACALSDARRAVLEYSEVVDLLLLRNILGLGIARITMRFIIIIIMEMEGAQGRNQSLDPRRGAAPRGAVRLGEV